MTLRPTFAVGVLGLVLCAGAALLGPAAQTGGGGGSGGGVGGRYLGPGDTVPSGPSSPGQPPPSGPPAGSPGVGPAAGPSGAPPPVAPLGPPPGTPPPGYEPPGEPATPSTAPPVDDPAAWQLWWHYNRWDYLPVEEAWRSGVESGGSDFFLGRGAVRQSAPLGLASALELEQHVRPALLEALRAGGRAELLVYSLQALARLPSANDPPEWNFEHAARTSLREESTEIVNGALLALGMSAERAWTGALVSVLHEGEEGRRLLGRTKVGPWQRAFAAYGLALLAAAEPDGRYRMELHRSLAPALADESPEVQAAVLAAIGHAALPWKRATPGETQAEGEITREQQIALVGGFLEDEEQPLEARAQAPYALGLLGAQAAEPARAAALEFLLAAANPRARAPGEIQAGAVLALGDLGRAGPEEIDARVRQELERRATRAGGERLARYLALVSLARCASRPGPGEEPLAALEPTRRFLLQQLEQSRGLALAWSALALAVLEQSVFQRGGMPAADTAHGLRAVLLADPGADAIGAVVLGLGLLRDAESAPLLLKLLAESGSAPVRGYAALALGMIADGEALAPMRSALASCQSAPGALQDVAIGLSLLGDPLASSTLSNMLLEARAPETQRSLASALGWIRDPRLLPLLSGAFQRESDELSRAWLAVALGRIASPSAKPWNAALMRSANYFGATATLTDPRSASGVLDYP